MNRCTKCGVDILDDTDVCPLCCCVVEANSREKTGGRYPDIRLKTRKLEMIGRIVLFISIVTGILSIWFNYRFQSNIWWSAIVVGGLAYLQLILFFIIENEYAGYRSKGIIGIACGLAYAVLIDYVCGFAHWSVDYAAPATLLALDMTIIVLMFVNIRSWQSYIVFQIFMIFCSGTCVALSFMNVIKKPVMSYTAFGLSCILFLASVIIGGRRAGNELKRRFHVM